jgi:hypothetical protein
MSDTTPPPVTPEPPVIPPVTPPVTPEPPVVPPVVETPAEPSVREKTPEVKINTDEVDMLDPIKAKDFISKTVSDAINPVNQTVYKQQIEKEVADVLNANPEYKPYEKTIRAFVNHPNRAGLIKNGLPIATVALEAVAPFLQKIGAEKERKAREAADATRDAGGSRRPNNAGSTTPDFANMTPAQIQEVNEQVKSGRYQG